ncbi:unnamed protein product [Gordionus sp. m RMFG-2023]
MRRNHYMLTSSSSILRSMFSYFCTSINFESELLYSTLFDSVIIRCIIMVAPQRTPPANIRCFLCGGLGHKALQCIAIGSIPNRRAYRMSKAGTREHIIEPVEHLFQRRCRV